MKKILVLLMIILFCGTYKSQAQADPSAGNTKTPVIKYLDDFGANATDTIDDSQAFQNAAKWFDQNNGHVNYNTQYGVLKLSQGTYLVGKQHLDVNDLSTFGTVTYQALFQNFDGLIVEGATDQSGNNLTKIKIIPNSYFGYFNKADLTLNTPLYGADPNNPLVQNAQAIGIGTGAIFLLAGSAKNMVIRNMEMDGNSGSYRVGYPLVPNGDFNCFSYAVNSFWARYLSLENLDIHDFGEDGIIFFSVTTPADPGRWNVTMSNVKSQWNGRQALSWVGGRDVKIENSTFAYTRLKNVASNTGANAVQSVSAVAGSPGANIDIEPEGDNIRNGVFNNCKILGNWGTSASLVIQLDADSITFNNCQIQGGNNSSSSIGSNWQAIGLQNASHRSFTFNNCDIVGNIDFHRNIATGQPLYSDGITLFNGCSITESNAVNSPDYYGAYAILNLYDRIVFNSCTITQVNQRPIFQVKIPPYMAPGGIPSPNNYATLNDCSIYSTYNSAGTTPFDIRGQILGLRFTGNTKWFHDVSNSPFDGQFLFFQNATLNGSDMYSPMNTFTFPNTNVFEASMYSGSWLNDPTYDSNVNNRPIIIGETPCEYLQTYIGESPNGGNFSVFNNTHKPLYIGEGVTLTVRKGSVLILSGDIYLAGMINVDPGGYILYNGDIVNNTYRMDLPPRIHCLGNCQLSDHIRITGTTLAPIPEQPPFIWTFDNVNPILIYHSLRSDLMAPNEYLKSTAAADRFTYDDPNAKCIQCTEITGSSNLDCNSFTLPPAYLDGGATGISETNQGTDIDIYPNPTADQITIRINDLSKIFDIRLFDLNGRLLYKTTTKNSEAKLSLGKYPNGTYVIKMTTADKIVTRKVIKSN